MASLSEGQSSQALVQSTHHEQLDAVAELAQICHFCGTFQAPLKLPTFSRTDLQAALIAGTTGDDREIALLAEVHFKLVREQGAKLERMIQDWERAVARKVTDNWRLEFSSNPFDGAAYDDLTVAQRIQVLNVLCHWKLDSCAEIQKFLSALQKETDPKAVEALRATPIGYDDAGAAYWYFGDCCWVYAEDRPEWQSEGIQKYAVEFADAKRIRLSINFDPTRTTAVPLLMDSIDSGEKPPSSPLINGDSAVQLTGTLTHDKMQITALMDEQIEEDEDEDEPLPIRKTEEIRDEPDDTDTKPPVLVVEAAPPSPRPSPPPPPPPQEAPTQSRKMDITMLCGSPPEAAVPPKAEPMEEDEHDVSEDRFMSTIVSTRDPVKAEASMNGEEKIKEQDLKVEPELVDNGKEAAEKDEEGEPDMKKRRLSEDRVDVKKDDIKQPPEADELPAPPKRRKTRFHDIIRVSDNTSQSLAAMVAPTSLKVDTSQALSTEGSNKEPAALAVAVVADQTAKDQDEDFDIMCAACQRAYDRRYLDPPLENRPAGEWRCFECLVNDARGWPRRRNPPSKSPKGSSAVETTEEAEDASSRKKSPSSSKRSKSKSSSKSSSSSKKKSSSSSRSASSSSSKKKMSSSSSKKSSKKRSKKSSSSSSRHHSSSSSHHHHHNRHREEFAKLLTLAQGRKRERLAMEESRLQGAHLHPVSLDGPTGWRVVCCSVEGLRQVIEKLAGGSLEQDRLRGRLILILKVEEKMEAERLKKQQLWHILPRRQSSRVAMGRIKTQHSGESASDSEGDDKDDGGAVSDQQRQRSSRSRGATNGHDSRDRLARDRESRAKRRRLDDGSDSDSECDQGGESQVRSVAGWINWTSVQGDTSLTMVCSSVIDRLLKEDISELFARPVDPEEDGCPDYLTVIQQPMDLGTIRTRVTSGFYTTWELFKTDIDLVWTNCRQYNSPDTVVVEYADALDLMFKQMRKEAERHGVRKMGKLKATEPGDGVHKATEDDEAELQESSDDNASGKDNKAKSDSSASEMSSEESDDSSEAGCGNDDDDETSASKRTTRNRTSGAKTSGRSSRTSARPNRPSRSPAASTETKARPSRSRKAKKHSDSEEEDDDNSAESDDDEEPELDSDDSDIGKRSRSSRSRQPRRGVQSSKPSPRRSGPRGAAPLPTDDGTTPKPPSSRRNHVDESSNSSSSEGTVKGDDSSSSSDSDDAGEDHDENPPAPAEEQPPSVPDPEQNDTSASTSAPPPPSTPPPPPPPLSANNTPPSASSSTSRKPKPPSAGGRSRAGSTSLLNQFPQSPASSSSYFSSSDSESSAGGSSSDSD